MSGKIEIKLVKSPIACPKKHRTVLRGLGLRKLNQACIMPDNSAIRGMIKKINYLLEVNGPK